MVSSNLIPRECKRRKLVMAIDLVHWKRGLLCDKKRSQQQENTSLRRKSTIVLPIPKGIQKFEHEKATLLFYTEAY